MVKQEAQPRNIKTRRVERMFYDLEGAIQERDWIFSDEFDRAVVHKIIGKKVRTLSLRDDSKDTPIIHTEYEQGEENGKKYLELKWKLQLFEHEDSEQYRNLFDEYIRVTGVVKVG